MIRRGSARKKYHARRAYLEARPDLYEGVPGIHDDVTEEGRPRLDALHVQMVSLGMFGRSRLSDQREAVRRLVSELRGEHVGGAW